MAKNKRAYILASCLLSGAATILTVTALATEGWITSQAVNGDDNNSKEKDSISVGLFSGVFVQTTAQHATYQLTMACAYDLNICALLCGANMVTNLKKMYHGQEPSSADIGQCPVISDEHDYHVKRTPFLRQPGEKFSPDKVFINAGVRLSTIIFVVISAVMGLVAAGLALLNSISSPPHRYFNIFGLYVYNSIAFFSILMAIIMWAILYVKDLLKNIPTYQTFLEGFSTNGYARMGYSYWLILLSLFVYMGSIGLLYYRNYVIAKDSDIKKNGQNEREREPL